MNNKMIAGKLLKVEMDGLKDADMLVDYADKIAAEGDTTVASALYSHAKARLSQISDCKRMIEQVMSRAEQEAAMAGETFHPDAIYAELYNDWINSWEEKIRTKMM